MSASPTALDDLRAAVCSDGAPSARNLLVTVFGDALLPHGEHTKIAVQALTALLESFSVNERLVRTSLTRLVNEGLLATTAAGRRSYYAVAPGAFELFRQADRRIYGGSQAAWDGSWTIVVIDGTEATAKRRARLRQELAWAGLGTVAPNVMASPMVDADVAAGVVAHVGGFSNVLVSRSSVIEGAGILGADELARRVANLDEIADRYDAFVARFERFDAPTVSALEPELAFKLRTLLVAEFRRIALADPQLPAELLPSEWVGRRARVLAGTIYAGVATESEQFLAATADPPLQPIPIRHDRFTSTT